MRFALLRVAVLSLLLLPFVGSLVRASVIGPSSKHHDFAAISPREVTAAQLQAARDVVAEAQRAIAADKKARMEDLKVRGTNRGFGPLVEVDATVTAAARLLGDVEALRMKMRRSRNGEGDGAEQEQDEAVAKRQATTRSFWMEGLKHNGTMAFNPDPTRYVVWRNVKDFGAKGDGITDDTDAINRAIQDGNRCVGPACKSSTVKGALVYFPSGTYLVHGSIYAIYNTQLVGNPNALPTIKASPYFVGYGVINTNGPAGQTQWYVPQSNFYRQIRNFNIDLTSAPLNTYIAGIHYQIAQATSIYNVHFLCSPVSPAAGNTQQGIYMEDGSGGFISNMQFENGAFGLYMGNQQFTSSALVFRNVATAIQTPWSWSWTWRDILFDGCGTGISVLNNEKNNVGATSITIQDAVFKNGNEALRTYIINSADPTGSVGIVLDNVALVNVKNAVVQATNPTEAGTPLLAGGSGVQKISTWVLGKVHLASSPGQEEFKTGIALTLPRNPKLTALMRLNGFMLTRGMDYTLLPKEPFLSVPKPQYETLNAATDFMQLKAHFGAVGDGRTDDTEALQNAINEARRRNKVLFIDSGAYVVTRTIDIPQLSRIVGECWAQIIARGPNFADQTKPTPVLRVGRPGDAGSVEIQDLLVTSFQGTAGLVGIEWNIGRGNTGATPSAMWDTHVRLGGAMGTSLQAADCPVGGTEAKPECIIGSAMMHITDRASAYLENVWLWTADHDLDFTGSGSAEQDGRVDVYVARGLLVTSTTSSPTVVSGGVWLYGTAAEHAVLYQYAFAGAGSGASPIVAGLIQTEAPYWQPKPGVPIPRPFESSLGLFPGDDTGLLQRCATGSAIPGCDEAWALRILLGSAAARWGPADVQVFGAGLYSFFSAYTQDCIGTASCQRALVEIDTASAAVAVSPPSGGAGSSNAGIWLFNLFGIGSTALVQEMSAEGTTVARTLDNPSAADMPGPGQHKAGLIVAYQARS